MKDSLKKETARIPLLCAYLGHILWGFSYLFSKTALLTTGPNVLLSYRFILASVLMGILILGGKVHVSFKGKDWLSAVLLIVLQLLYYSFESYSIYYTNATISGAVLAVAPVVAILFAILLLKEYPSKHQAIFCILPVIGVIIMTVAGNSLGIVSAKGAVFLFLACITSGAYKTINRKTARSFTSSERTFLVLSASAIGFTISALSDVGGDFSIYLAPLAEPSFVLSVAALGILCSIGANLLVNYAVGRMSVVKLSSFGAITTLCSMVSGVILLGEPISWSLVIGAVLILLGIYQVTKE